MSTPATPPPDYGEPWKFSRGEPSIESCYDDAVLTGIDYEMDDVKIQRAVACVNACQGMADPAAEIAHLRDFAGRTHEFSTQVCVVVAQREAKQQEIDELRQWKAEQLAVEAEWDVQKVGKLLNLPLGAAIRPAIQPAIEAMREAIREAHSTLKDATDNCLWRSDSEHPLSPEESLRIYSLAMGTLAKLQPFLP